MNRAVIVVLAVVAALSARVTAAEWLFTSQLGIQSLYDDGGGFQGAFSTLPPETNRAVQDNDGKVYVSNPSHNAVYVFHGDGTGAALYATLPVPIGLALDDHRRLYVSSGGTRLVRYFADGRVDSSFQVNGLCGAHDVVFHKGLLYLSSQCGRILVLDQEGTLLRTFEPGLSNLVGLAIDDSDVMYFTSYDESPLGTGAVGRMRTDGGDDRVIVSGLYRPHGIQVGPDGKIYVVQLYKNNVLRFDSEGSSRQVFIPDIARPLGISYLGAAVSTPFRDFNPRAEIELGPEDRDDSFQVAGSFRLADASNGIDPLTESVAVGLGDFSSTVPAGSFVQEGPAFVYRGRVEPLAKATQSASTGGAPRLYVKIAPSSSAGRYTFKFCVTKGSMAKTTLVPQARLSIGDDLGQATLGVGQARFAAGTRGRAWVSPSATR